MYLKKNRPVLHWPFLLSIPEILSYHPDRLPHSVKDINEYYKVYKAGPPDDHMRFENPDHLYPLKKKI